ncbi:hypothetical protein E2C01_039196 [Portunus trituberculatus]|uniref:Uncharacterized protein n=1 Tax=Portunus trituberculatus TaxID=210409 RepID=A0A5B7FJ05_PORTR|nr:hypothetical protein [Portunus trituberculatus]
MCKPLTRPPASPPVRSPVYLPTGQPAYPPARLPAYPPARLPAYPPARPPLSPPLHYFLRGRRGTVQPCVLWGPRGLQAHGFQSCPRSECRLGFLTRDNGFLAGGL